MRPRQAADLCGLDVVGILLKVHCVCPDNVLRRAPQIENSREIARGCCVILA
jgi:hypothetical protein